MYQKLIKEYFDKASLYYTEEIISRFNQFLHLLLQYNKSHDLTRITNIDEIIIKHFVDSLIITKFITIPSPLLDIGTGAGFPGIPLAIVYPDKRFILAESRHKRTQFLSIVNESLQLKNIEIYPHLVTEKSFFEVGGVITRAVESINETLQRCNHFLKEDNSVLLMKGPSVDEENITMSDSYSKIMDKPYTLPATSYKRRLIVYKKTNVIIKKTYFINKEGTSGDGLAITSGDNKHYKELKKIIADPRKCSMSTVVGKKIIKELVSSHPQLCRYIVLHDGYGETDTELIQIITDFGQQRMILLKKALFNEIDVLGNNQPILVIDVPPIAPWDMNTQGLSLMIPFQDPVNVGAAIRSAVAFGVNNIIICKNAAYPFHPKAIRSSAGAVFQCNLWQGPSLHQPDFMELSYPIIALDLEGINIYDFTFPKNAVLLAGVEGQGLHSIKNCIRVTIPIQVVESLNATVALSIALYEWHKQINITF